MSELTIRAHNPQQAHADLSERLWPWIKAMTLAGHRLVVTARRENRTLEQNAKFHAICTDLEKAGIEWSGRPRDAASWKVLLVSGHAVATKGFCEVVEGLEGELVNLRESTAQMNKSRSSSLIEYSIAFAASHGVVLRNGIDMETGEILARTEA